MAVIFEFEVKIRSYCPPKARYAVLGFSCVAANDDHLSIYSCIFARRYFPSCKQAKKMLRQ